MFDFEAKRLAATRNLLAAFAQTAQAGLCAQLWNGEVVPLGAGARSDIRIVGRNTQGSKIEIYSGLDHSLLSSFTPFAPNYRFGARVAVADVNFDGIADIIVASGVRGASVVKIFNGANNTALSEFIAFPLFPTVALFVAASSPVPVVRTII